MFKAATQPFLRVPTQAQIVVIPTQAPNTILQTQDPDFLPQQDSPALGAWKRGVDYVSAELECHKAGHGELSI